MYEYFISFSYSDGNSFGFGNMNMKLKSKIVEMGAIAYIEKLLKEKHNKHITIINFQLLGG